MELDAQAPDKGLELPPEAGREEQAVEVPSTPQGGPFSVSEEHKEHEEHEEKDCWSHERFTMAWHGLRAAGWTPEAADEFVRTTQLGQEARKKEKHDRDMAERAKAIVDKLQKLNESKTGVEALHKKIAVAQAELDKMKKEVTQMVDGREQMAKELLELQTELDEVLFNQAGQG
ncbi:hypothetical protein LPJ61_006403, partial [Coemansia biformis]